ncbi:MAG: anhydro-N-acetylmuramic acid kinase [Planctomycetes bacterium]|nr:anhydro-N-acetylmuramic acid kinase [Planctomycetota bacterium]
MSEERLFIGLYSGPAADGIDAALASVVGAGEAISVRQVLAIHHELPDQARRWVLMFGAGPREPMPNQGQAGSLGPSGVAVGLAMLDRDLGQAFASAAEELLAAADVQAQDVSAVGMSGQAIAHIPPDISRPTGAGLELGCPAIVARKIARPVVAEFSKCDIAAGGQGGPICAWADWILMRHETLSRAVVHLGGIASLTFVPAAAQACDVVAWDVGPGTCLLDDLAHKLFNRPFDHDGGIASAGKVNPALLNEMMSHPYFQLPPPKTTSRNEWGASHVWRVLNAAQKHACDGADLLATVAECSAMLIAKALAGLTERPHEIILSGGGAMNISLAGKIRKLMSPCSTYTVERYGCGIRSYRAVCMAVLAAARLDGIQISCPAATGSPVPATLGSLTLP